MENVECEWSKKNIMKLFASMNSNIPNSEKMHSYICGLKAVDWHQVAFPPFSPDDCENKWKSIMDQIRKIRTLPELLAEAKGTILERRNQSKVFADVPGKPGNAFVQFYCKQFSKLKKKHPHWSVPEISKMIAEMYRVIPDKAKAKCEKMYALKTEEYWKKKKEFCEKHSIPLPKQLTRRKKASANKNSIYYEDDGLPVKPPGKYVLFLKDTSEAYKGMNLIERNKAASKCWAELSKARKEEYTERHRKLVSEYKIKLSKYLDRLNAEEKQRIMKEKHLVMPVVKLTGEPKIKYVTSSLLSYFVSCHKKKLKRKFSSYKEQNEAAKALWRKLSEKEKDRYKDEMAEKKRIFATELQKWFKTLTPKMQKFYLRKNPGKAQYLKGIPCEVDKKNEQHLPQPSDSEEELNVSTSDDENVFAPVEEDLEGDEGTMSSDVAQMNG